MLHRGLELAHPAQRQAQPEPGIVLGRIVLDDPSEALGGLAEMPGAEQRPAQGLPDTRRLRLGLGGSEQQLDCGGGASSGQEFKTPAIPVIDITLGGVDGRI
jgi:hypothetical protein